MSDLHYYFAKSEYFFSLGDWQHVDDVVDAKYFEDRRTLALTVTLSGAATPDGPLQASVLLQVPRHDVLRLRFDPTKQDMAEYSQEAPRSMADTVARTRAEAASGGVVYKDRGDVLEVATFSGSTQHLLVRITRSPFRMEVLRRGDDGGLISVVDDADTPLMFRPHGAPELGCAVMAVKNKPPTAQYSGFGEHGGTQLFKSSSQHNFFNYDNFGYRKIYGTGPTEEREPLYHSATFFLELNGRPGRRTACGVFVDSPGQTLVDLGTVDADQVRVAARFGELDYYLFVANTPQSVLHRYSQLIDHAALKPRWALGYHQGCYGYDTREKLEAAARTYRDERWGTPIDGLHLDVDVQRQYQTFTVDDAPNGDGTPARFPDPGQMFDGLHDLGFKCSTNITPIISVQGPADYESLSTGLAGGCFVGDALSVPIRDGETFQQFDGHEYATQCHPGAFGQGQPFLGAVYYGQLDQDHQFTTTGYYPDFGRPEVRAWWGRQYQHLFDLGLDMVWQDMTTPAVRDSYGDMQGFPFKLLVTSDAEYPAGHLVPAITAWNLYSYNLHRATYTGLNALRGRENLRNFVIGRGSTSGTARYAALWTGDNTSTWDFLRVSVPQMLALGLSGQPMAGADVGGFATGDDCDTITDGQGRVILRAPHPDLLARWTAAGAFFPWFRNHYTCKTPDDKTFQEPWAYEQHLRAGLVPQGKDGLYATVLPVARYMIGLRYRLLQVFYDAMFANLSTGLPICRVLSLVHPEDASLFAENLDVQNCEFMVGNDLLVAPVLAPEGQCGGRRDVYLPTGTDWYSFKDDRQPLSAAVPGGTTVRGFDAHLDVDENHLPFTVPLYVRAGAVVPVLGLEDYVGQRHHDGLDHPVTYSIYPGVEGSYTSYLDDGVSRSSAPTADPALDDDPLGRGEYRQVTITHRTSRDGSRRYVEIEREHDGYTPQEKYFVVQLLHDPAQRRDSVTGLPVLSVRCAGLDLPRLPGGPGQDGSGQDRAGQDRAGALKASEVNAWYHDEQLNATFVKVFDDRPLQQLVTICAC